MRRGDLANWVTVREEGRLTHAACYAASDASHGRLRGHAKLPFMVFGGEFVRGVGSFGQPKLDKALGKGASLRGSREPLCLYPFSLDDPPSVALRFIISGIVSCIVKSKAEARDFATAEGMADAIKAIHPFYDRIGTRHAKLLVRKATTWFAEMLGEDGDLKATTKRCSTKALMPAPYRRLLIVAWRESTLGSGRPG